MCTLEHRTEDDREQKIAKSCRPYSWTLVPHANFHTLILSLCCSSRYSTYDYKLVLWMTLLTCLLSCLLSWIFLSRWRRDLDVDDWSLFCSHYFQKFTKIKYVRGYLTRSQVKGWNPLEGSTKSSCEKLRLGGMLPASNSRKG
jgi:hypothetical protein